MYLLFNSEVHNSHTCTAGAIMNNNVKQTLNFDEEKLITFKKIKRKFARCIFMKISHSLPVYVFYFS